MLAESAPLRLRFAGGPDGFHFFGDDGDVDAVIRAAPEYLLGLLTGVLSPEEALAAGASVQGDPAVLAALPGFFQFSPESPSSNSARPQNQGTNS